MGSDLYVKPGRRKYATDFQEARFHFSVDFVCDGMSGNNIEFYRARNFGRRRLMDLCPFDRHAFCGCCVVPEEAGGLSGGLGRDRTCDQAVMSRRLYH